MADASRPLPGGDHITRRGFIVHVGTATALLGGGMPALA